MLAAMTATPSHPAVAVLLGLGAAALAGLVVVMAWNVHVRQIRLAGELARRQFTVAEDPAGAEAARDPDVSAEETARTGNGRAAPPVVIDGPETVIAGEQARYRLRPASSTTLVSWAVGGGSVSQSPDPTHPDELLVIADQPGDLTVIARAREGLLERRATKSVTAVPDLATPAPAVTPQIFLHAWGLLAIAVLIVGFAASLDALGSLTSSDFIALAAPLAALLGLAAIGRGTSDAPRRPGRGRDMARPGS
jgi:hypothetical protein